MTHVDARATPVPDSAQFAAPMEGFVKWPEKQWAQMADLARPAIKRAARDEKEISMFEAMCFEVAP